jgi:HPt (histidine-containing phosphotransfer) domain-containing protein
VPRLFEVIECLTSGRLPTTEAEPEPVAGEVVFNEAEALARAGGDRKLVRLQVQRFLADYQGFLASIRSAVVQRDASALEIPAHTFKGRSGAFSQRAMKAAELLEDMARGGNLTSAYNALSVLEAEIERLTPVLSRWLEE